MSYHKFSKLGEKFNAGDLTSKMMKGVFDFNMRDRACNCIISTLEATKLPCSKENVVNQW